MTFRSATRRSHAYARCLVVAALVGTSSWPAGARAHSGVEPAQEATHDGLADARRLYDEGSARYAAADYTAAIENFTRALEIVTRERADASVSGALLLNLAKAHVQAYEVDADLRHLRAAKEIYGRYARDAERAGYPVAEAAEAASQRDVLASRIAEVEARGQESTATPAADDPGAAKRKSRRNAGIGTLVAGGVLTLAGAGGLAYGATFKGAAERQLDDKMLAGTPEGDRFLEDETRKGKLWMGGGGAVLAVGVAGVILGAILLSKAKTSMPRSAVVPAWGPGGAGLLWTGRF